MKTVTPCVNDASALGSATWECSPRARDRSDQVVESQCSTTNAPRQDKDRELVVAAVAAHTSRVAALVKRHARGRDRAEAMQVGLTALLEARELFDPSRGVALWTFAYPYVHGAISKWAHEEHFGVKSSRYGTKDPRAARAEARKHPDAFNEEEHGLKEENPESLLIEAEGQLLIQVFVSGISSADRLAVKDGRHNSLRERAKAFLGGGK